MPKVILHGFIIVADHELESVLGELPKHISLTRQEPGCISFEVTQDAENCNRLNVYEEFDSEAAFNEHQERTRASQWGKVSANADRHYDVRMVE